LIFRAGLPVSATGLAFRAARRRLHVTVVAGMASRVVVTVLTSRVLASRLL
jgi:hypothetical protein